MHSFEFKDGQLLPITDPLNWEGEKTFAQVCGEYGFESEHGEMIGNGCEGVEIIGPAKEGAPYQWVVNFTVGGYCYPVWCASFIELQGYLATISPVLIAQSLSAMRETVADAHKWLFDPGDGLFADHVCDREGLRQEARRRRARPS